eukprot:scaffold87284_cov18-Tisochrysis_lutea.AAC.1
MPPSVLTSFAAFKVLMRPPHDVSRVLLAGSGPASVVQSTVVHGNKWLRKWRLSVVGSEQQMRASAAASPPEYCKLA